VLLQDQRPGVLSVELRKLLLYFTIAAALKTFGDKLNAMLSSSKGDTRTANRQSEGKRGKDEHEQIERERERRERERERVVLSAAASTAAMAFSRLQSASMVAGFSALSAW
jgi:hypothetical protein